MSPKHSVICFCFYIFSMMRKKEILRIALNFTVYFAHKHCKLTLISTFLYVMQEQKE